MRTVYCSDNLTGDRRKGWRDLIGEVYAPLDIDIPTRADFFGRICRSTLGDIELTEVQADVQIRPPHNASHCTGPVRILSLSPGPFGRNQCCAVQPRLHDRCRRLYVGASQLTVSISAQGASRETWRQNPRPHAAIANESTRTALRGPETGIQRSLGPSCELHEQSLQ